MVKLNLTLANNDERLFVGGRNNPRLTKIFANKILSEKNYFIITFIHKVIIT